jgi:ribosomal protein S12 methylthiotransferase
MAEPSPGAPTVSLISLGCPRTLVDSELYLGALKQQGFRVVEGADGSDTVIINTCAFVQEAIQESIDTVLQAVKLKQQGKVKSVIVAGCLVQRFKDELIKELPDVDGFLGVDGFTDVTAVVQQASRGEAPTVLRPRPQVPHQGLLPREPLTPGHYAYLKVSEGCLKGCAFCIIPKIKGPLSSRPLEDVVAEARMVVEERGARELIIVGQDTSDYGVDRYGRPRIAELLAQVARINGVRWVRLLYCHPHGLSDEIVETIRDVPAVCKYLDMAIEHADDGVLKRMNRLVTQAHLRERIGRLRAEIPGIALRTSVIVGFPGETEAEFDGLLGFLRETRFDRLGAFTFSPEQGSAAIRMPDQVPAEVARARYERLMEVQQGIAADLNAAWRGRRTDVVIDDVVPDAQGVYLGRTAADCPEVDGTVYVHSPAPLQPGDFVPVTITDTYEYDLVGTVISP